jgi:hypothetical protein
MRPPSLSTHRRPVAALMRSLMKRLRELMEW